MMVTFFIRIMGKINSRELFELIEHLGNVNVTDCGEYTLVYGECWLETASRIIFHCALYGDAMVELTHNKKRE